MASGTNDAASASVRKQRAERIKPFVKDLSVEREPKANKALLLSLLKDLKDEGNQLFKEQQFAKACAHYKHAIFVAKVLEDRYYHEVDGEFMATLHSNGSLSSLKMNNLPEALQFADQALVLRPNNVKAKYRKVQALFEMKRYKEAIQLAKQEEQTASFKEILSKAEAALQAQRGGHSKSASASAAAQGGHKTTSYENNDWLAETNALKTEKQRKTVLDKKMNKKKKPKNPQPVVRHSDSSESDEDSDSSNLSEDDAFASNYAHVRQSAQIPGRQGHRGSNVVHVTATAPDPREDVLQSNKGFKTIRQNGHAKNQPFGMGLDDFSPLGKSGSSSQAGAKAKAQTKPSASSSGSHLPPVSIYWPLEDAWQFRLACDVCFVKSGDEGYKAYNLKPNLNHKCEKNVLLVRRKDNQALNWIKVRPFPRMFNNRFMDFKMCQQFSNAMPCKIGEPNCTFAHNNNEKHLWHMERDGEFSVSKFIEELRQNNVDTSEDLASRQTTRKPEQQQQQIPGLNFKTGSRQRLSSPAPVAKPAPAPAPVNRGPPPPSPVRPPPSPVRPPPSPVRPGPLPPSHISPPVLNMPPPGPPQTKHTPFIKPALNGPPPRVAAPVSNQPAPSPSPGTRQYSPPQSMATIDNSLKDYDYKIVCPKCFVFEKCPGKYKYSPNTHVCEENVLAVKQRNVPNAPWFRVRERSNHREFPGKYILCNSVQSNNEDLCRFGEANCSYAHNEAEQRIWGMEKARHFSITDFILKNRAQTASQSFTIKELMKKHGGFFTNVCRDCFFGRPPRISEIGPNNHCSGLRHIWGRSLVLAHVNRQTGEVTIVDHRKFTNKQAFFRICKFLHFCQDQVHGKCLSAHSMLERDVWMLERDTGISREEIIAQSQRAPSQPPPPPPPQQQQYQQPPPTQPPPPQQQGSWAGQVKQTKAQPSPPMPAPSVGAEQPVREKVPYLVQEFCGMCWTNGTKSLQEGATNRCGKGHSNFNLKKVYLITSIWKELRALPSQIPRNLNFVICRFVAQGRKCTYVGQGPCQFAHSEEERVLWIWMARNKMHRVEDVVKACQEETRRSRINQGDSVVAAAQVRQTTVRLPTNLQDSAHYCRYCSVQCNSERQWEDHCASDKHTFNVNSDKDHQWNYRQPPWGQGSNLDLCVKHMDGGRCTYSPVPDMFNLCKYAHSQEELDEWRERFEWRQMKRSMAREQNMFSYMDQLLEAYTTADSSVTEMAETVPGVQVSCKQPLQEFRQEKNAVIVWSFIIHTQLTMEKVALLYHNARLHFYLLCTDGTKTQIASGEQFEDVDDQGRPCYRVKVYFTGGMFGSFNQTVVFDFGKKPVLMRNVNVELGHHALHEQVLDLRDRLTFDRWTPENRQVLPYHYWYEPFQLELIQKYRAPGAQAVVTQDVIKALNRHNYVHKMRRMLDLEEVTRHKLISNFNVVASGELMSNITLELGGMICANHGELFLRLPLSENLTEDTGAGKLLLTSVRSALLTRTDSSNKQRVYEAKIEVKGKDYVCLALTPVCVRELKLQPGTTVEMEVQFQLDRMHFINMHYALDSLVNTDIVFPDVTKINPIFNERHTLKVSSRQLNQDQLQAVRHIVAERTGYTPPFIMYGPFGTGKTETLAQAAMVLLREKPDTKILICAQSNSAADLYVVKHLDPYLRKTPLSQSLLLRIVSRERRLTAIPEGVKKYCCYSPDGQAFEMPTREVVLEHRVVVTTVEMSLHLTSMGLRGHFTHVFIDEAAQVLECETVMPLTLASERTCVVLTGDHMQISPKVYSAEARRQNFGMSLLERLHMYYFEFYQQLREIPRSSPLTIFLSINYRTKFEILRFISAVFYGGPDKLTAGGVIPSVVEITPLLFYAVQGREVQDADSTSFFNHAESCEVVERVTELLDKWPQEWGKVAPEEIGIVTPYHDQVKQIRFYLKNRRRDLRAVNVETVQNIQGKEFRALFISTVRTHHLLESEHVARALAEAESVGGVTDFAFLSDRKLLNTALTRTKSMVAVVGDPVALCAIGECIQEWRTYLKHCDNMRSICPPNMNYNSIKAQVVHLQMSPMGRRLKDVTELCKNPLPARSVLQPSKADPPSSNAPPPKAAPPTKAAPPPRATPPSNVPPMNSGVGPAGDFAGQEVYIDELSPVPANGDAGASPPSFNRHTVAVPPAATPTKPTPLKPLDKGKGGATDVGEAVSFDIVPDQLLLQLALDSVGGGAVRPPLKVECVSVRQEADQAVVFYDQALANEDKRKKMLNSAASGQEFEEDACIYRLTDQDTGRVTQYYNYTPSTLQAMLHNQPERYRRCTLQVDADRCTATLLDSQDSTQRIEVRGSLQRGRAFHNDQVVVEVLEGEGECVEGRVVGILRRAVPFQKRSFVCSARPADTGLLTPVNPGAPPVYNAVVQKHTQRVKKGFVCVYRLSDDLALTFSHFEKVEADDSKLFVVRYLKWLPGFFNPIGVVVGVLPAGQDLASALDIVRIQHHLPSQFSPEVLEEAEARYPDGYQIPVEERRARQDMSADTWCFTIGAASRHNHQVAYSIQELSDASYEVCVHMTDAAFYLQPGSALDRAAQERAVTVAVGGGRAVDMVPERVLSAGSLRPGQDRCALSVFMTVSGSGEEWHVADARLARTVVSSKHAFTHADVEKILDHPQAAESDYLHSCVLVLFQIALMRRKQRKGNGHLEPQLDPREGDSARSQHMVQELLVMANCQVASLMLDALPPLTPLLTQPPPLPQPLEAWKSRHAADAINSVALTKPFLAPNKVCQCRMVCMCVFSYMKEHRVLPLEHFDVLTRLWEQVRVASAAGRPGVIQKVVSTPDNHPQSSVALQELQQILPQEAFVCSGDVQPSQHGHYSLNVPCYTDVTSPLQCYVSVVTQRLVSSMLQDQPAPYTQPQLSALLAHHNHRSQQARAASHACTALHLAAALQARPLTFHPVLERLDKERLRLHFPNFPYVPDQERQVEVTSLRPSALPQLLPEEDRLKLTWQERIYDVAAQPSGQVTSGRKELELCADRFVSHIVPFHWQKLLAAVREQNEEKILSAVPSMQEHVLDPHQDGRYAVDVSSEERRGGLIQHYAEFSQTLQGCTVLQVVLGAAVERGVLAPCLQLFSLSPTLSVCLQHQKHPHCFTSPAALPPAPLASHPDLESYQRHWLPVLAVEAAQAAVQSGVSATIHNVTVVWNRGQDGAVTGRFSLSRAFCLERHIVFSGDAQSRQDLGCFRLERGVAAALDLMCVRYAGLELDGEENWEEEVGALLKAGLAGSWVGHCVVTDVGHDHKGMVNVRLSLQSSLSPLPPQLLHAPTALQLPCSLQWIPNTPLFRQMEYAVACLKSASDLAKDIAVGRKPVNTIDQGDYLFLADKLGSRLNAEQKDAVCTALKQPFTVVTGPPGSGKTMTAAHLAALFVERNRMTPQPTAANAARTQLLICTSSDAALDIIQGQLQALRHSGLRLVRVYDEAVESEAFPLPRSTVPASRLGQGASVRQQLRETALHHMVRGPNNPFQQQITEFDSLFSLYPQDITDDQVEEYLCLVRQAEQLELKQAEVILATCSTAATPRMAGGSNIKQVILDGGESCMEAESLLPVILHRAVQQVVVMGDPQQLTPRVHNSTARSLGLATSLLQRYAHTALTLREQYRMHQGIVEAPSVCFYQGGLKVSTKAQLGPAELDIWPASLATPLVFCHTPGPEEHVTTETPAGVRQSPCNRAEAQAVASLVAKLVAGSGVGEGSVVVMSPCTAQRRLIQEHLTHRALHNVTVASIRQCQGLECDYVVLSTVRWVADSEVEPRPSAAWLEAHLGEMGDPHQINLALTRARKGLIIFGNKLLLQTLPVWSDILELYRKHKALVHADTFIRSLPG